MAIAKIEAPAAAWNFVNRLIRRFSDESQFRTPKLRAADPARLTVSDPHRVTVLSLDQIHGDNGLRMAGQTADWRFLIFADQEPIAAIEAVLAGDGNYRLGQLNEGPFVAATVEALRRAKTLEGASEPLLIVVPALNTAALWLQGPANLILPLPPLPAGLEPYQPVAPQKFFEALAGVAKTVPRRGRSGG